MNFEISPVFAKVPIVWDWLNALYGVGIAILALLTARYIANLLEYTLLYLTRKTTTLVDDGFVKAVVSTFRIAALLLGFIGFFFFETKFVIAHVIRYDIIFIISVYLIITVFVLKVLNLGYNEIKKFAQPPKSYFEINVLKAIFFSMRVILIVVLVLLALQVIGFPTPVLWSFVAVLAGAVIVFMFIIFYEASSAIFIRSNIPIKVGDIIRFDGMLGSVVEFGYRFIKLVTPENSYVYIPYKLMKDKMLENLTQRQSRRFRYSMHLPWGVTAKAADSFLKKVNKYLIKHESILSNSDDKPETDADKSEFGNIGNPFAYLVGMGDDGIEILVQYRVNETDFHLSAKISERISFEILKIAEKEGVLFPDSEEETKESSKKTKTTAKKAKSTKAK